ncbi:MAG: DUF4234 domain-containing protein [Candidatus Kapaibacterium sp.]
MAEYPYPVEEGRRDILISIILTLVTCGIYGLFWQSRQMDAINAWQGREEFNFWKWFFISIITCGIYSIYIEYKMAEAINRIQQARGLTVNTNLPLICLLVTVFGFGIVSNAIQQSEMNNWYPEVG